MVVAASTLLGLDDLPGDLEGYGPIDAFQARALAAGGVWRRIVTDPLSGAVLDVGRARYRPPADLVEHVRERDGCCVRPGCSAPARASDLDHTEPFHPPGGPGTPERTRSEPPGQDTHAPVTGDRPDTAQTGGRTSAGNLGPACRRDHLLKTHAGHRLVQDEPGSFLWTTPTGHRYRTVPGASGTSIHLGTTRRGVVADEENPPPGAVAADVLRRIGREPVAPVTPRPLPGPDDDPPF